jgi:hypothetical protein
MQTLLFHLYQHLKESACLQAYHYFALFDQVPQSHLHPESVDRKSKNGRNKHYKDITGTNLLQPAMVQLYTEFILIL